MHSARAKDPQKSIRPARLDFAKFNQGRFDLPLQLQRHRAADARTLRFRFCHGGRIRMGDGDLSCFGHDDDRF